MFCSHCKSPINAEDMFCPHCGQKIAPPETKRQLSSWLKLLAAIVIFTALIWGWNTFTAHDELGETIEGQLKALKNHHITEAYYEYGSNDFEGNISLNAFRDYVDHYPILTQNNGFQITERKVENNLAEVKGFLSGKDNTKVPIEYTLIKEKNKWKILNMQMPALANSKAQTAEAVAALFKDTAAMRQPIEGQLKALKENDLSKAYSYVSKEFREITSQDTFAAFLKRYPILSHYDSYEIKDVNDGILEVHLKDKTGTATFEYFMGFEENQWKVNGLRAQPKRTINA